MIAAARLVVAIVPDRNGKVWRSFRARRGLLDRIRTNAMRMRDRSRPLVWFHAPSVGEGLQARAIIEALREEQPDVQIAYTFFSPSAESFAATLPVELADYLPLDGRREADALLDALAPTLLAFVKLDVWPNLVARAKARGIPVALLSATMSPRSARRGKLAGYILRDAYAALDAVGAIDQADAERLLQVGVRQSVTSVTGDTRFDQVWHRAHSIDREGALLAPLRSPRPTLVAGSTWPADERVLLSAWTEVLKSLPEARLIIAPHEPTEGHVSAILQWAREARLKASVLSEAASNWDVLVVNRTGVLGDLYSLAQASYVGGGFHDAGLHSVLEPAAYGVPVAFGPRYDNSREAGLFLHSGAGVCVSDHAQLTRQITQWLADTDARERDGHAARAVVQEGLGAAVRSQQLVAALITSGAAAQESR